MYAVQIAESKEQAAYVPPSRVYHDDYYEDEEMYDELRVAKSLLLTRYPFWGILGLALRMIEVNSPKLPTLATDGKHIFYNPEFIRSLAGRDERVFAVAHEIFHALYDHAGLSSRFEHYVGVDWEFLERPENREELEKVKELSKLWNYAADFVVNSSLVEARVGEFIKTITILYDEEYIGWSVEEVFEHLKENPDKVPQGAQTLDQHIEIEIVEGDGEGGGGGGEAVETPNGVKIRMTREEFEALKQQWRENMSSAAAAQKDAEMRAGGEMAGCIPSTIQRMIDSLAKPKVNWRQALKRYVNRIRIRRYAWTRPNRGLFNQGWTVPGMRSQDNELDIVVMFDTSGSISQDQLTAFVSELQGILAAFPRYNVWTWCFDAAVQEDSIIQLRKHHDGDGWNHMKRFIERISGGGGTDFEVNWDFMKSRKMKPKLAIMLTDGVPFGGWGDVRYCPTMYFIMGNTRAQGPKGAMTVHYEQFL